MAEHVHARREEGKEEEEEEGKLEVLGVKVSSEASAGGGGGGGKAPAVTPNQGEASIHACPLCLFLFSILCSKKGQAVVVSISVFHPREIAPLSISRLTPSKEFV